MVAFAHTGLKNSGAHSLIRTNNAAGSVRSGKFPFAEEVFLSVRCLPLFFQRSRMAKVELRDDRTKERIKILSHLLCQQTDTASP
jgi:hypothetical protein